MSRVGNNPITLPSGVEVKLNGKDLTVKGGKGELQMTIHEGVDIKQEENVLTFAAVDKESNAMFGTTRALVNNMGKSVV